MKLSKILKMKEFKLDILQVFILLFCTSTFITSCRQESNEIEDSPLSATKSFESYISDTNSLKNYTVDLFNNADKSDLKTAKEIENYLFSNIKNSQYGSIEYLNTNFYQNINNTQNKSSDEEITIEGTGLSEKTVNYFNQLISLNENQDYSGMVTLLNQYKSEYDSDPHLESLAGVFSTIEVYQDDLLNKIANKSCEGDVGSLAEAAVAGAISGARFGWFVGSFFGPAGTAGGAIGGAIAGAVMSSIVNIGIQILGSDCV